MGTRPVLFTVATGVIAVAVGIGAYLAVRQNESAVTTTAAVAAAEVGARAVAMTEQAVETTEQVVTPPLAPPVETAERAPAARAVTPERAAPRPAPARAASGRSPSASTAPDRGDAPDRPAPPPRPAPPAPLAPLADDAPPAREALEASAAPAPTARRGSARAARGRPLPRVEGWVPAEPSAEAERPPGDVRPPADEARPRRPSDRWAEADAGRPAVGPGRELVIEADAVIGLQVDSFVTTRTATVEDEVHARVTRDVLVEGEVAVPAGAAVRGSVTLVEQAGRLKGASRLGVRFHTVVLDDGVEVPVVTETVYREAGSGGARTARTIGGAAVGGAVLGAIFGGRRGAAVGGAAGAGGGAVAALAGEAEPATLPYGSTLTVRLSRPAVVTRLR